MTKPAVLRPCTDQPYTLPYTDRTPVDHRQISLRTPSVLPWTTGRTPPYTDRGPPTALPSVHRWTGTLSLVLRSIRTVLAGLGQNTHVMAPYTDRLWPAVHRWDLPATVVHWHIPASSGCSGRKGPFWPPGLHGPSELRPGVHRGNSGQSV